MTRWLGPEFASHHQCQVLLVTPALRRSDASGHTHTLTYTYSIKTKIILRKSWVLCPALPERRCQLVRNLASAISVKLGLDNKVSLVFSIVSYDRREEGGSCSNRLPGISVLHLLTSKAMLGAPWAAVCLSHQLFIIGHHCLDHLLSHNGTCTWVQVGLVTLHRENTSSVNSALSILVLYLFLL